MRTLRQIVGRVSDGNSPLAMSARNGIMTQVSPPYIYREGESESGRDRERARARARERARERERERASES
jgi:hypothetical protein